MKIRPRLLAVLLSVSLLTGIMAGCGSSGSEPKEVVPAKQEEAAESESTSVEGESKEDEEAEAPAEETAETAEEAAPAGGAVTIEEQVLVDQDGIRVTATEYVTGGFLGDSIKLLVENNSDKDYTIGCDALIVNDYMIGDLFASEIAAGKKANETIDLYSSELKAAGIDNVGKIEIYFHAYDSDWNNLFENVYAEIHTSAFDSMDTQADDSGMELFNGNGIRIVGKTVDENSFWGTAILLYCENTCGKNVCISVEDMSVNGFMMDPFFATNVYDGKKSIQEITLFSSELEENGIESIEEVELKFHVYDLKTYDTVVDTDPITFSAQ